MKMSLVKGVVTRITSDSPFGGSIFRLAVSGRSKSVRVVAAYDALRRSPFVGESLKVRGHFELSDAYGLQFIAITVQRLIPTDDAVVSLLAKHPYFVELGDRRAFKYWQTFGPRLVELMTSFQVSALQMPKVSPRQTAALCNGWRKYQLETHVGALLEGWGLGARYVEHAIDMWGENAVARLSTNPYILAHIANWGCIDAAASTLTSHHSGELRGRGAIARAFADSAALGHLAMTKSLLMKRLQRLLGSSRAATQAFTHATEIGVVCEVRRADSDVLVESAGTRAIRESLEDLCSNSAVPKEVVRNASSRKSIETFSRVSVCYLGEGVGRHELGRYLPGTKACHVALSEARFQEIIATFGQHRHISAGRLFRDGVHGDADAVVVHDAQALDVFVLNALLRRTKPNQKVLLLTELEMPPHFSFLNSSLAPFPVSLAGQLATPVKRCDSAPNMVLRGSDVRARRRLLRAPSKQAGPVSIHVEVATSYEVEESAAEWFRLCKETGPSVLVTATRHSANAFNRTFHSENLETQDGPGQAKIVLRRNQHATVGDQVIYYGRDFVRGLLPRSVGYLLEVLPRGTVESDELGRIHVIVARARFDGIGDINIRQTDCYELGLAYALPLYDMAHSLFSFIVVCYARNRLLGAKWHLPLRRQSVDTLIFVNVEDRD